MPARTRPLAPWMTALLAAVPLALGCSGAGGGGEPVPGAGPGPVTPVVSPADDAAAPAAGGDGAGDGAGPRAGGPPPRSLDPDGAWLLLAGHENDQDAARYAAVRFGAGAAAPQVTALDRAPAVPYSNWEGHYRILDAHDGPRWARVEADGGSADGKGAAYRAVIRDLSAPKSPPRSVPLGAEEPTGLYLVGDVLVVGFSGASVSFADLAAKRPALTEVVRRDTRFKGYDLFVRDGAHLLAIDDIMRPMYADWLRIGERGVGERLGDWTLPGVVNGRYEQAALVPRGEDRWSLYLVASYGVMSGHGHNLFALDIRGRELLPQDPQAPRVLREHVARGSGAVESLVAGAHFTPWSGLAVEPGGERLLLAAGDRGVLVLPADFAAGSRGELVDLGGAVSDVRVHGGRILALVSPAPASKPAAKKAAKKARPAAASELVLLERAGATLKVTARHRLPGAFYRMPR